ncbi:unnamed protein product [Arctia plantaginis]|uniref:Arrestin C-terminal-like domain-containing protein n=1 Tax=Arctia plantaginis TaxID=874455 RepID=A0A8S1BLM4_ARCPL|nr:unnamed protein product [Arctia plantaginis]CAB3260677.1 unnamed protein product [Arctia plantaginis]
MLINATSPRIAILCRAFASNFIKMGIFCEMNLFKPSDGAYHPGQVVSGKIKYAVDEPMEFDKITTSLKGNGYVIIRVRHGNNRRNRTYRSNEVYVDRDIIIQDTKVEVPVGCYEIDFSFTLPMELPSSLNIRTFYGRYNITCRIIYYIRIKFERPGFFAFNKHFKKEITVISGGVPKLSREPVIYGDTKKVMSICSCKTSNINIKATILNSVIPLGGKIILNYEVENKSNVLVKSVETKLVEIHTFKAAGYSNVKIEKDIPDTDCKTSAVNCGDTQRMPVEINVLSDIHSLANATIVLRDYFVRIVVQLPIPHINAVLDVPVQIGAIDSESTAGAAFQPISDDNVPSIDPPPSYWEAMGETKKEDDDITDDENDNDKGK